MTPAVERSLKRLDGVACHPATVAGAILAAVAGVWRRPSKRALVVRPGGLGDLVLCQLAVENLGLDPREITWLIERRSQPWAQYSRLPHLCYDAHPPAAVRALTGRHSLVINSEQRFGLSMAFARLARGRRGRLIAFSTNRAARWASTRVAYDPLNTHEAQAFAELLVHLPGADPNAHSTIGMRRRPADGLPVVAVGGLQSPSRTLSVASWAGMAAKWAAGRPYLVVSSPTDRAFAASLVDRADGHAELFEGSFDAVCDVICAAPEIFAVDSGLVHVASYFGVPATVVFTSGRAAKWAPLAPGSRVVARGDLPCQPCTMFGQTPPCPRAFACRDVELADHRLATTPEV